MRPTIPLLIALALALAGCVTPADDAGLDPADDASDAPDATDLDAPTVLALDDCEEVAGAWPMPADELRPYLPPGFEPAGVGAPVVGSSAGVMQLITATCTLTTEGPANGTTVSIATAWIMVDPPPEYTVDGVGAYLVAPWTVLTGADAAGTFSGWGLPATAGTVDLGATLQGPPVQLDEVVADDGAFALTLTASIPARETQPNHPIFRAFTVADGEVTGAVDIDGGSHPHWEVGASHLQTTGSAPFPLPTAPGVAIHGFDGQLHFRYVPHDTLDEVVTG